MALTPAQQAIIKAYAVANFLAMNDEQKRDAFNATASPDFWVWKTLVTEAEVVQGVGPEGTTFTWVGNGFITRSAGEQAAWNRLFAIGVNPSLVNVRQAFNDILSGTGNAALNRTHLLAVGRRKSRLAEKLLAVGTGTTVSPATMGFEGELTTQDVIDAMNS